MKKKVAIIGCGAIFNRHAESIGYSKKFELTAVCDVQKKIADNKSKKYNCKAYYSLSDCLRESEADFYVLATSYPFKKTSVSLHLYYLDDNYFPGISVGFGF